MVRGMGSAEVLKLFGAYVEAKQKQNVLDYDDLLLYWAQIMVEGAIAQDISARFDHVLVDEYQDTNRLQASILLALKPSQANKKREIQCLTARYLARPKRFELLTPRFVVWCRKHCFWAQRSAVLHCHRAGGQSLGT
jgi:UvrD/REP helicase N-terminal domain